jgi:hypothetical protein
MGVLESQLVSALVKGDGLQENLTREKYDTCNKYYDANGTEYAAPAAIAISWNTGGGSIETLTQDEVINGSLRFGYGIDSPDSTAAGARLIGPVTQMIVTVEEETGYTVTVDNRTAGKAAAAGIVNGEKYSGETEFDVTCEQACVVAYSTDGGETYTKLTASGTGNTRSFMVPVNSDTIVFIAIKGDATLDGKTNATDATQVKRYAVKLRTFDPENLLAADVTGEGKVNATDATQIKRYAVKLRTFDW